MPRKPLSIPYHSDKSEQESLLQEVQQHLNHPFLLANQVGGNDDLLFDGRSIIAADRAVVAPASTEGILLTDLSNPAECSWLEKRCHISPTRSGVRGNRR